MTTVRPVIAYHRDLSDVDIARIARKYHSWRGEQVAGAYSDEKGFCASSTTEHITEHGFVLTPGRYVGPAEAVEDDEPFEETMQRLTHELKQQLRESETLNANVRANLIRLGFEM
jgi:type I restriction enzyme M protein